MATPFKVPKRKQPTKADRLHMQSPLSRVQDSIGPFKTSWYNRSSNGTRPEQFGSLNGHISRAGKDSALLDVCKVRLGPGHPGNGNSSQSTAFQRRGQTPVSSLRGPSSEHNQWRGPHLSNTLKPSPPRCQPKVNGLSKKPTESPTCKGPVNMLTSPVTSQSVQKAEPQLRWRPKRASDTLCQDENQQAGCVSPPFKTSRAEFSDSELTVRCSPVESDEEFESKPSPERKADQSSKSGDRYSPSPREPTWRRHVSGMNGHPPKNTEEEKALRTKSVTLSLNGVTRSPGPSPRGSVPPGHCSLSSDGDGRPVTSGYRGASPTLDSAGPSLTRAAQEKRLSLGRPSLRSNPNVRGGERRPQTRFLSLHLRLRRPAPPSTEPIVLSSEDEEGRDDEEVPPRECPGLKTPPRQCPPTPERQVPKQVVDGERTGVSQPLPCIMELSFRTLHAGEAQAQANGNLVVTDDGITLPLKDSSVSSEGEGTSLSLVASQLRGYGVWDGGLAQGGSLFQGFGGRAAPSLLFLWVSDAQANLVQTELSVLHPITLPGQACPFLLLVLCEQLGDLQAALLASMLDVEAFRQGRSHDLKSPLSWAEGVALIHSCPQDTHLLSLLGQSLASDPDPGAAKRSPTRSRGNHRSLERGSRLQTLLPTRLIQYPPLPSRGRIAVTTEDLDCLDRGQFLNDVIIDFYLKYLLLERAPGPLAERCHVFSSFFYKQLTRRDTFLEEAAAVPARDRRHQRVGTWTRNVDIFDKDYLFVPVNHEAHWYLVVICFPGLEQAQHEEWSGPVEVENSGEKRKWESQASAGPSPEAGHTKMKEAGRASGRAIEDERKPKLRRHSPPECTQEGCRRKTVVKKPCILVMDSLKLSYHEPIYKLLRDYLHVEWRVRRRTPRDFTGDSMKGSHCRVPLQDNSSDCGLYLLQYVESFLQNPVVHFDLPVVLEHWFPRQQVWRKREEIRNLVMELHSRQDKGASSGL
ncbi:sentrin-specific protease 7b isoform X2 [Esox lucius]|uniref:sentrin-specific protease 7b isoform X2 n=1 Tax=Esox lucius TaxID=8010 RepID=UPI001476FCF0|nr:sentrin-specific protease 7b isoform X2 [Esox lucius]